MSTTGDESVRRLQMTEKWSEEIFGTGGRGLKISLLRWDASEGRSCREGMREWTA